MLDFVNDYSEGAHEKVLQHLIDTNMEQLAGYGMDHYCATSGEYEAHLVAKDRGISLVDITLSVPVEETAVAICDNWQRKNQEIYKYLITELF